MNRFAEYPFVRILIPFVGGILLAIHFCRLNIFFEALFYLLLIYYLLDFFFIKFFDQYNKKVYNGIYLSLLFFFFGMFWTSSFNETTNPNHFSKYIQKKNKCILEIVDVPRMKEHSIKVKAKVVSVFKKDDWIKTRGNVLVYVLRNDSSTILQYGDKLIINSSLQEVPKPKNTGEFNFNQYCFFQRVEHQLFLKNNEWKILENSDNTLRKLAIDNRNKLLILLQNLGLENQEYAVASALILGYTDDLNDETRSAFAGSGALHVLAVSGLHVAIIYTLLDKLLMFISFFKKGNYLKSCLILILLWLYALITGFSPSVIRAATMLSFIVIAKTINRNANIYNSIAASAFTILCFDPYMIMQVGFQLSYLAVIGIIFLQARIYNCFYFRNKILDFVWNISAVSIAAQIATFPLGILYFHQFPNYFLLSNLIVIPLGTLILYVGILTFIFSSIPYLGEILTLLLKYLVKFLNISVSWIEGLPYSISNGFSISILETILIYVVILLLILFFIYKKSVWLQLSFAFISVLFIGFTLEKWSQYQQKNITFYSVKNELAIDFIDGKSHYFLAQKNFLSNKSKVQFHIQPNWMRRGLLYSSILTYPLFNTDTSQLFVYNHFYGFNDYRIFHWDSSVNLNRTMNKIKVNSVLISHNSFIDSVLLENNFECNQLILDGTNSFNHINKIKRKFGRKYQIIDLISDGAYEKQF